MKTKKRFQIAALVVAISASALIFTWSRGEIPVVFHHAPTVVETSPYGAKVLWPRTQEDQAKAGAGSGVAVNSKGNVLYLHRAGREFGNTLPIAEPVILELNAETGEVCGRFGHGLFMSPHGLAVDAEDNIWVTDVMLNKVFKLSSDGRLIRAFGHDYPAYLETCFRIRSILPRFPATRNPLIFARPTDVVVVKNGDFIVTDGYRNKRLAKFNKDGNLIWQVNHAGSGDGEFNLPHGLAMDAEGRLYVADRNNARIQVFSADGKWLATWNQPELGRPFGLEAGYDNCLYVVDAGDFLNGRTDDPRSQIIKLDLSGNILLRWGKWGKKPGELMIPHDIAVDRTGNLYVAELENNRLQRFWVSEGQLRAR